MGADLAALVPPLIVAAAFVTGVVMFLRRQMSAGRSGSGADSTDHIPTDLTQSGPDGSTGEPASTRDSQFTPKSDHDSGG